MNYEECKKIGGKFNSADNTCTTEKFIVHEKSGEGYSVEAIVPKEKKSMEQIISVPLKDFWTGEFKTMSIPEKALPLFYKVKKGNHLLEDMVWVYEPFLHDIDIVISKKPEGWANFSSKIEKEPTATIYTGDLGIHIQHNKKHGWVKVYED